MFLGLGHGLYHCDSPSNISVYKDVDGDTFLGGLGHRVTCPASEILSMVCRGK